MPDPCLRQALRASHSRPVVAHIARTLRRLQHRRSHLPQSAMGKAISYTLNLLPQLEIYLNDGRIHIDNNPVENAIRPTAIGKKNWLFIGEAQAGQRSAILYTLIESCRTHRLDPFQYLRTVLTKLPTLTTGQIKDHTPAAYAGHKREPTHAAA